MASFDDREKTFENKYKLDKELEFKIMARRNKLLGLWVAEMLHLPQNEREAYAKTVVMADFDKPGDEDVYQKVMDDLTAKKADVSEHRLRKQMADLLDVARDQVLAEKK